MQLIRNCLINRSLLRLVMRSASSLDGASRAPRGSVNLHPLLLHCGSAGGGALNNIITHRLFQSSQRRCALEDGDQIDKITDEEWRQRLTDQQYYVCRQHGTEMPFTGHLLHNKKAGVYSCVCCQAELFSSTAKFDSGSGWPSFFETIKKESLIHRVDKSSGMTRIEVLCRKCNSHLGHVFADGPEPTGQRYCINSASLDFTETKL